MGFENLDKTTNQEQETDSTHSILLASAMVDFPAAAGGSRVDQPGIPHVEGKIYLPNPNMQEHETPKSTVSASPGVVRA